MARKGCHVFRILADLATVLFLIRCNTATSGVCALPCSGHTSTLLDFILPLLEKQDSIVVVTLNTGDGVSPSHDIFSPGLRPVDQRAGETLRIWRT
jgi:hypothetical protein